MTEIRSMSGDLCKSSLTKPAELGGQVNHASLGLARNRAQHCLQMTAQVSLNMGPRPIGTMCMDEDPAKASDRSSTINQFPLLIDLSCNFAIFIEVSHKMTQLYPARAALQYQ